MNLQLALPHIALEAGEIVSLDDVAGTCIRARFGPLWITEENVARDFVIGAGQAHRVTQPGRTVVQAIQPAWVVMEECQ